METLVANMAEYVLRSTIMEWGSKVKVARPAVVVLQKYFVHYMSCISIYDILSLLNFFIQAWPRLQPFILSSVAYLSLADLVVMTHLIWMAIKLHTCQNHMSA